MLTLRKAVLRALAAATLILALLPQALAGESVRVGYLGGGGLIWPAYLLPVADEGKGPPIELIRYNQKKDLVDAFYGGRIDVVGPINIDIVADMLFEPYVVIGQLMDHAPYKLVLSANASKRDPGQPLTLGQTYWAPVLEEALVESLPQALGGTEPEVAIKELGGGSFEKLRMVELGIIDAAFVISELLHYGSGKDEPASGTYRVRDLDREALAYPFLVLIARQEWVETGSSDAVDAVLRAFGRSLAELQDRDHGERAVAALVAETGLNRESAWMIYDEYVGRDFFAESVEVDCDFIEKAFGAYVPEMQTHAPSCRAAR